MLGWVETRFISFFNNLELALNILNGRNRLILAPEIGWEIFQHAMFEGVSIDIP